jgi:hypothetical protein
LQRSRLTLPLLQVPMMIPRSFRREVRHWQHRQQRDYRMQRHFWQRLAAAEMQHRRAAADTDLTMKWSWTGMPLSPSGHPSPTGSRS